MSMLLLILGRLHRWAPEPASVPRGWPYTQSACTRYAQRNVTRELTPVLNCADSGQAIADNVHCAFSIITESFPEQTVAQKGLFVWRFRNFHNGEVTRRFGRFLWRTLMSRTK